MPLLHALRQTWIRCGAPCRRLLTGPPPAAIALAIVGVVAPVSADDDLKDDRTAIDLARLNGQIVVRADDDLGRLDDFSFDMDVRFSDLRTGNFFEVNGDWDQDGFYFQLHEGHLVLGFGNEGKVSQVTSPPNLLQTDRWYRLSGIKDGGTARLSIDGEEVAQGDVKADIADTEGRLIIGPRDYSPAIQIARFRLWPDGRDRLDAPAPGDGLPSPLIHYGFEEGQGLRIEDLTGGGHDARIEADPDHDGWAGARTNAAAGADRPSTGDAHADHDALFALDLSGEGEALVVDRLDMPDSGQDFAVQLDLMFHDLRPGVIAYAEGEQGAFFRIEHDAERLLLTLGDGREQASISSPAGILETGAWMTIAATHGDGIASLLINGTRVASFKTPSGLDGGPMRLSIGEGDRTAAFHLGALRVWGRSLAVSESGAAALATTDHADPGLLLAFGPWERRPEDPGLEDRTGLGVEGTLLGDPSDLWIDIDPGTKRRVSSDRIRLALDQPRSDRRPGRRNETERRIAARAGLVDIPEGRSRIMTLSAPAETIIVDDENVARAEILSPRKLYLFGAHAGRTGLRALNGASEIIEEVTLRVGTDTSAAEEELATIDGGDDNRFADRGGRPVLEGPADDVGEAMALAALSESPAIGDTPAQNQTTIDAAQQVNIKVRFAEVSRSDLDLLGINWNAVINAGSLGEAATGQFFLADSLLDAAGSAFGQIEAGDVNINFLLEALQQEGAVSMLAEPNLTVLNGEDASFLAGGELPIPVPQESGSATTVEFKPFGVSLDFRPVILGNDRISLRVASEVSDISAAGAVQLGSLFVPGISVRRAETSLELASGQTFAVGGLFNRTISRDTARIPGLGSIPILGALFRSTRFQRSETELVILITPYLVRPVDDPGELAFPGQSDGPLAARPGESEEEHIGTGFIVQ